MIVALFTLMPVWLINNGHGQANSNWFESWLTLFTHLSLLWTGVMQVVIPLNIPLVEFVPNMSRWKYLIWPKREMNQGHSQNISHVSVDVSLMVENAIQDKNGFKILEDMIHTTKKEWKAWWDLAIGIGTEEKWSL